MSAKGEISPILPHSYTAIPQSVPHDRSMASRTDPRRRPRRRPRRQGLQQLPRRGHEK